MNETKAWLMGWIGFFVFLTVTITTGIVLGTQMTSHESDNKREKFVACVEAGNKPLECSVAVHGGKA